MKINVFFKKVLAYSKFIDKTDFNFIIFVKTFIFNKILIVFFTNFYGNY